ncbi:Transcriptional regulator, AraC family [[Actinomadura] parvosata subsp. kistnae]|uniref:AraC family transcriptional regulator n=1 Tax=[Actinomadura] parvosata subsp. kistnae TaxID=1909395 RepID=A0A1V0A8L9_9ACTN|nr:AraC family transcriptional regulator [Nonomuraea sp. ATCC 55076]AQZ66558.1 AraC family transcriptional regulator [Nonomuraea sp. ATCC 55076]SPL95369.1 Transcriptional regulator, AraC family [Actinomadura parvosata subsp. kistnae]
MDVLSDVIAVMRTGRPRSARVEWRAPWGQRFPAAPGSAGFQVVLRGAAWLLPPDGPPVALSAGDVLFFPRGHGYAMADSPSTPVTEPQCDPYTDESDLFASASIDSASIDGQGGPATVLLCGGYRLDPSRAHPLLRDLPDLIHLPAAPGLHSGVRAAVELLGAEIHQPGLGADTIVSSLLDMLLLYILRAWFAAEHGHCEVTGWAAALADPAVSAALDAMHRDPARPWSVAELGARAGLSRAAFARRFTTLVGQPPLAYLTWWRLSSAGRLLRETDAPLSEIAAQVGYGSEFAFANAFKREYGVAPGKYRRTACPPPVAAPAMEH